VKCIQNGLDLAGLKLDRFIDRFECFDSGRWGDWQEQKSADVWNLPIFHNGSGGESVVPGDHIISNKMLG